MDGNIKGLVAAGHEMASELKAECGAVDMRSVAKLISDLATQLEVQLVRANALAEDQQKAIESIKQADSAVKLAHEKFSALEAEPVSQTYNLPELIEGMEVSIDVSTCDADLGNRYFGTVTEALELDTAKNGYILLVQDAEPNFDVNGNSPGIPDGWISCSERMPEDTKMLLAFSQGEIVAAYWNWVVNPLDYKKYRAFTYLSGNILDDVTHWMPLPEPPQEVK
ncbi:DUF551 domain-containing protein [Escherichia coli]|uniref:DUF551 domain-containing protein n=2 Tax=Escherichia coli TaxID=562 RepID=UPI001FCF0F8A|nr:DUF551 domain-containing protein [Escherichia coli]